MKDGKSLQVMHRSNRVYANRTRLIRTDVMSTDGVMHLIGKIFHPPGKKLNINMDRPVEI